MLEGRRALILEDEPIIAFALEDMLESMGCASVLVAARIDEAHALLAGSDVDIAILDVNIHGERSYPVADELVDRGVPFVFATGYGDMEHPDRYRGIPTVTKPYSVEQLRKALSTVIAAR